MQIVKYASSGHKNAIILYNLRVVHPTAHPLYSYGLWHFWDRHTQNIFTNVSTFGAAYNVCNIFINVRELVPLCQRRGHLDSSM